MKGLTKGALATSCAIACIFGASEAMAQDAPASTASTTSTTSENEQTDGLADIVVTATKMGAAAVQDIPAAISAFSADALDRSSSSNIRDLVSVAPGLTVSENTGFAQVYIRGIGSNNVFAGSDASTTTQVDGVYLGRPSNSFGEFLDLERVEILRGPQGTLYGRNSVGGTINIITRDPTNDLAIKVRGKVGNYDQVRLEGVVSGPIVQEVLQASIAAVYSSHDDYIRNIFPGSPGLNSQKLVATRGKLRFSGSRFKVILAGDYALDKGRPWGAFKIIRPNPGFVFQQIPDLHTVSHNGKAFGRNEQYGASATINVDLTDELKLTSITAHRRSNYSLGADTDGTELNLRYTTIDERQKQTSQELQFNLDTKGLNAVAGVYYFDEQANLDFRINLFGLTRAPTFLPRVHTEAYAAFGQMDVKLNDAITLTGGLRYSHETKKITQSGGSFSLVGAPPVGTFAFSDRIEFDAFTPKLGVKIKASDDVMLYASATRGFKSGGFNISSTVPGRGFLPETVWAYEAGVKTELLDRTLRLNASAFYYDYKDLQVQTFVAAGVVDISNAASARIKGVEVETVVAPLRGVELGANISYLDATYKNYAAVVQGRPFDASGNTLSLSPRWKIALFGSYVHELGSGSQLFADGNLGFQDEIFFSPDNSRALRQQSYSLLNARLGFRAPGKRWEMAAFVKNAFNTSYLTAADTIPQPGFGGRTGDPRTYGLQLTFSY